MEHALHPTMQPTRPSEEHPREPRLPGRGGPKRNHPSWRGRYVHGPRYGVRAAQVTVKTTWHPKGKRGFRSMTAATAYELRYMRKEHEVGSEVDRALYTRDSDRLAPEDRTAFAARAREDGWQWRMIISPEYGKEFDITQLTREVVKQVEKDTGYTLDWVATNHYNTAHPHSHVIIRGTDLAGQAVGLKRDYLSRGIPYRARDLATEQLGRRQVLERDHGYQRDIEHEQPLHDPRQWKDLDAYERTFQPPQRLGYDQELDRG